MATKLERGTWAKLKANHMPNTLGTSCGEDSKKAMGEERIAWKLFFIFHFGCVRFARSR
jgi:hypothetical protein